MNETKDIKIPIKAIVEQQMNMNGAKYEEDEFNLLRKYFIACLNLGYLKPDDLNTMVGKFASQIKFIVLNYNNMNKLDYYVINGGVLYINGMVKDSNSELYEISFYKAVSEVIFKASDKYVSFSTLICQMVAEKIYNMDTNASRIILPSLVYEKIGEVTHNVRSGYLNYSLLISLLKQLLISKKINENILIRNLYFEGIEKAYNTYFEDSTSRLLLEVLDKILLLYINFRMKNDTNPSLNKLIEKYQIIVNDFFKNKDVEYFAFLALVTTDELREKLAKTINNNESGDKDE